MFLERYRTNGSYGRRSPRGSSSRCPHLATLFYNDIRRIPTLDQRFCFIVTTVLRGGTRHLSVIASSYLHRLRVLKKLEIDPRKPPIRTGTSGKSRESLETWKLAVSAYAGRQGLYPLLRAIYITPLVPVDTSTDEVQRSNRDHATRIQSLWFLLTQSIRGSEALILKGSEHNGDPNGREAWVELERIHDGQDMDIRGRHKSSLSMGGYEERGAVAYPTY